VSSHVVIRRKYRWPNTSEPYYVVFCHGQQVAVRRTLAGAKRIKKMHLSHVVNLIREA
jgi:hypothetical protein